MPHSGPRDRRLKMIEALEAREDLLPSGEWPWTTDRLRRAYADLLAERGVRDEAVRLVDARHGYSVEFASSPEAHRAEYDAEEDRLNAL